MPSVGVSFQRTTIGRSRIPITKRVAPSNGLLAALPPAARRRIHAACVPVRFDLYQVLYKRGEQVKRVYFPTAGLVSRIAAVDGRMALEVGLTGAEGVVGMPETLGLAVASDYAMAQSAGTALRMTAAGFRREVKRSPAVQCLLYRHSQAMLAEASQAAACLNFHGVEARLARWLLTARDRLHAGPFQLTHKLLALMLGTRRVAVTLAAGALRKRGLIRYRRGSVEILDAKGLETAACGCYRALKRGARPSR